MKTHSRMVSLVVAVTTVGVLLLTACTSSSPTAPAGEEPAASSNPYGSLNVGLNYTSDVADPIMSVSGTFLGLWAEVYDTPIYRGPDGKMQPGIAERWEIAPDGKTHTFYIKKGVKFHDGSDLTGADVKFSIDRMLGPDAPMPSPPVGGQR